MRERQTVFLDFKEDDKRLSVTEMHEIQKVFLNYKQEEKWLNALAKKGLILADRSFGKYSFVQSDTPEMVSVVKFKNAVNNGDSDDEIKKLESEGQTYICGYRCWGYFRGEKRIKTERRKENASHYFNIALLWFTLFLFSLGTFSYQLNFMVFQKMNGTGFFDKPKTVCAMFAILTLLLAIPSVYYATLATIYHLSSRQKKEDDK